MKYERILPFLALGLLPRVSVIPLQAAQLTTVPVPPDSGLAAAALTAGVHEIAAPGLPGIIAPISANAFPAVAGQVGKDSQGSVVAASVSGKTRIVGFGHDGYLDPANLQIADTAKLMDNALSWTSGGIKPARIGVLASDGTLNWLKARGYNAIAVQKGEFAGYSTLVINGHSLEDSDLAPLQKYLAAGGGLIVGTTGWGWAYNDDSKALNRDFVGNQLLAPYGLVWTKGTLEKEKDGNFSVGTITLYVNAKSALNLLQNGQILTAAQTRQIAAVLGDVLTGLPASDPTLMPTLLQMLAGSNGDIVPFERAPITLDNPKARLLLTLQIALSKNLPVGDVKPSPAGEIFPGDVPPTAKPTNKVVKVDTSIPDWHSLGLYAAPGVPITIRLPGGLAPAGLSVRIGANTDTLYGLDSWKRAPEISRSWPLNAGETKVANPFGGLVYIVVPEKIEAHLIDVSISGAYEAPLWVQGVTTLTDWKNTIRWLPGPWAEISTGKVILTVPSRAVRDLEDPGPLCDFYNQGLDGAADLFGISRDRKRPERIVADVQISAGYMHSGYPIMTWLDVENTTVHLDQLVKFPWGHWHEIGHNHQQPEWTFAGTGEVTNNLLPLYVWNVVLGHKLETGHPALAQSEWAKRWAKYDAGGHQFSEWQSDPWLALEMYMQMQEAFGWEPFKTVFAEYRTVPESQKPTTEEQKHDQWMVRMAHATGKNLGPFFQKWGVPTSQGARDSIAALPDWMPEFPQAP